MSEIVHLDYKDNYYLFENDLEFPLNGWLIDRIIESCLDDSTSVIELSNISRTCKKANKFVQQYIESEKVSELKKIKFMIYQNDEKKLHEKLTMDQLWDIKFQQIYMKYAVKNECWNSVTYLMIGFADIVSKEGFGIIPYLNSNSLIQTEFKIISRFLNKFNSSDTQWATFMYLYLRANRISEFDRYIELEHKKDGIIKGVICCGIDYEGSRIPILLQREKGKLLKENWYLGPNFSHKSLQYITFQVPRT